MSNEKWEGKYLLISKYGFSSKECERLGIVRVPTYSERDRLEDLLKKRDLEGDKKKQNAELLSRCSTIGDIASRERVGYGFTKIVINVPPFMIMSLTHVLKGLEFRVFIPIMEEKFRVTISNDHGIGNYQDKTEIRRLFEL